MGIQRKQYVRTPTLCIHRVISNDLLRAVRYRAA